MFKLKFISCLHRKSIDPREVENMENELHPTIIHAGVSQEHWYRKCGFDAKVIEIGKEKQYA